MHIRVYQIIKSRGADPHKSLCHIDNRKYFSDRFNIKSKGSRHDLLGGGKWPKI